MMETKQNKLILLSLVVYLFFSCESKQQSLTPRAYADWVTNINNGLQKSKKLKEYEFKTQFKPLDFIVVQEEKTDELSTELLQDRKQELGNNYWYFNFRITNTEGTLSPVGSGVQTDQQYQERLSYFTFEMQQDLYLIQDQDTLPCLLYQFVRNYDVAPFVEFALGFKSTKEINLNQNITFVFEDKLLGVGTTKLLFNKTSFQRIPKIKTL